MKVATITGPHTIRISEEDIPVVGPRDVLTSVVYAGICGTDHSIFKGESSFLRTGQIQYPVRPGHEWSGIVKQVGSEVKNFMPGDRVVGDTSVSCGDCPNCMSGRYNLCPFSRCVGTVNTWDGAYAEYMIMPARHMYRIPDAMALDEAALVEPAATALHAVRLGGVSAGDVVVVHGTGTIGFFALQFAKVCGAAKVILTGIHEGKLGLGRKLGADVTIDAGVHNATQAIMEATNGRGADCVIEASGALSALSQTVHHTKPGGTISVVGMYERPLNQLDIDQLVLRQITLRGVNGSPGMFEPAMELMASGRIDSRALITHRYRLEAVEEAMSAMQGQEDARVKMLLLVSEAIATADEEWRCAR
ncbi:zinc-dependent alcohol dehydrogenase [Paenibacillus sp.]|uniref:zinc-dependent alcohol dehydrogenase n=1 Tax=Paenibacillus sp. TaxID=58172 RepID=UPI002D4B59F7|nr:alcohol dehydrogenase catalytic domain-containing protein [Paenibacillus sp.]HZG58106.1 alcohol dehydrogenase catalytic domain-containing protein [Paenibacillus sp.]